MTDPDKFSAEAGRAVGRGFHLIGDVIFFIAVVLPALFIYRGIERVINRVR